MNNDAYGEAIYPKGFTTKKKERLKLPLSTSLAKPRAKTESSNARSMRIWPFNKQMVGITQGKQYRTQRN
jgi:hypothetical protein